jgi:hypothetical protein
MAMMAAPCLSPDLLALLFLTGCAAGFFDSVASVAGGGGLIALPALLSAGLPPHLALGTNQFQGSFGALSAAIRYIRGGARFIRPPLLGVVALAVARLIHANFR